MIPAPQSAQVEGQPRLPCRVCLFLGGIAHRSPANRPVVCAGTGAANGRGVPPTVDEALTSSCCEGKR
jgi:hypothetical protein